MASNLCKVGADAPKSTAVLPSVSLCIAAYNEEATIGSVIEEAHDVATRAGVDFELIVCDDGSRDKTAAIIDEFTAKFPRLRVLACQ